jgi:hypothetical protein
MIKLTVDYGKPYEEEIKDLTELKIKLIELRKMAENEELPFLEVDVEIDGKRWNQEDFDRFLEIYESLF